MKTEKPLKLSGNMIELNIVDGECELIDNKDNMMKTEIISKLEEKKVNSAWLRGVKNYAIDLVDGCEGEITRENLLNGAADWSQYSEGGCALIYDADIAEALCTPSELKRTDNGRLRPNSREGWIDVQSRALRQAYGMIKRVM